MTQREHLLWIELHSVTPDHGFETPLDPIHDSRDNLRRPVTRPHQQSVRVATPSHLTC